MEEACGCRHRHQGRALGSSAGLTEDENARRVAAEVGDVVPDPLEGEHEIELACVAGVAKKVAKGRRREFREVKVAEEVEAVVESDDDRITTTGEANPVVDRAIGGAGRISPAVDVDQNGAFPVIESGSPDVEVETVFTVDRVGFVERSEGGATLPHVNRLRGLGTEGETIADTCPGLRSDRWGEPGARSVGTIRNSFEDENVLIDGSSHPAGVCGRDRRCGPGEKSFGNDGSSGEKGGGLEQAASVHGVLRETEAERFRFRRWEDCKYGRRSGRPILTF
jgi:hypothetical protein